MTLARAAEALLLAYDSEPALAAACAWAEALGQPLCDAAEVRLCVATGTAEPAVEATAAAWCLARGFEHVPPSDDDAAAPGEAQGAARVLEALHAHTWPGLVAKPRAPRPAEAVAAPRVSDDKEAEGEDFEALMGAMLQARDAAAGGGVSDDARRATAAALAMRMAQLLGEGEEEEED